MTQYIWKIYCCKMQKGNRTQFAVLGMLMAGPRSGYDLKRQFEEQIGHFWSESLGQIYPTLARLKEEGSLRVRTEKTPGRPDRKVYSVTERGRKKFDAWFDEAPARERVRNELLLKVFFGTESSPERVLEHIERYEAEQTETGRLYRMFSQVIEEREVSDERRLYWRLALASGRHINRARLAWCREAKASIREHRAGASSAAGKGSA